MMGKGKLVKFDNEGKVKKRIKVDFWRVYGGEKNEGLCISLPDDGKLQVEVTLSVSDVLKVLGLE